MKLHCARAIMIGFFCCAGCNRCAYDLATRQREQRIHKLTCDYAKFDAGGPERIGKLRETYCRSESLRPRHLARLQFLIDERCRTDDYNWHGEGACKREAYLRNMAHGRPEAIPTTFGKMFY